MAESAAGEDDLLIRVGLTEKQYMAALARMEARSVKAAKGAETAFRKSNRRVVRSAQRVDQATSRVSSHGLRMMSMQLSQVASQGALTGNYLQALAIQAPDLALGFGAIGIAAGASVPLLYGLAQAYLDVGDKSEMSEKKIEAFVAAAGELRRLADIATAPLKELEEQFGAYAGAVQHAAQITARAALSGAMTELKGVSEGLREGIADVVDYSARAAELAETLARVQAQAEQGFATSEQILVAREALENVRASAEDAANGIGMSVLAAVQLEDALRKLDSAEGMSGVAAAARDALAQIDDMFASSQNIPPEVAEIVAQLEAVLRAAASGVAAFDEMAAAAGGAADQASRLAQNIDALAARERAVGGPDRARDAVREEFLPSGLRREDVVDTFSFPARSSTGGRGGRAGGGGGGRGGANPILGQLELMQNSLMTQEEMQIASFERQQETLQAALEQRLITQQDHAELMEQAQRNHAERMAQIDVWRYGTGLQQAETFFGDMANAFQGGSEKMARIAQTFGAIEALINAWRAYNQVLADPSVPFFAKFSAAAAVLGAGMRAVNAIKGADSGGASGGAAGGAATSGGGAQGPQFSRHVAIQLNGSSFSRDQVRDLINAINEEVESGAIVRLA